MKLTKETTVVGVRVRCLWQEPFVNVSSPAVYGKLGSIFSIDERGEYYGLRILWDDAALNTTIRHTVGWGGGSCFEILDCPENDKLLAKQMDQVRRLEHAMKYL